MDLDLPVTSEEEPLGKLLLAPVSPDPIQTLDHALQSLQEMPQVDCPLDEAFSPGLYVRTIFMPKGTGVVGCQHKTRHLNIVRKGVVLVSMEGGQPFLIDASERPYFFISESGVRKVLAILENTTWETIHETNETDPIKLAELLIEKPSEHALYRDRLELQRLRLHAHSSL